MRAEDIYSIQRNCVTVHEICNRIREGRRRENGASVAYTLGRGYNESTVPSVAFPGEKERNDGRSAIRPDAVPRTYASPLINADYLGEVPGRARGGRTRMIVIAALAGVLCLLPMLAVLISLSFRAPARVAKGKPMTGASILARATGGPGASDNSSLFPNHALTPGRVVTIDASKVCRSGYSASVGPHGNLWRRLKDQAYGRYGLPRGRRSVVGTDGRRHAAYEVDHLIPIELGGDPTSILNLWPEPVDSARIQDRVENDLHDKVCTGGESLTEAQDAIAKDWMTAIPSAGGVP